MAAEPWAHRNNGDSGEHPAHGRIAGGTSEHLGQGHRARHDPGAAGDSDLQVSTRPRVTGSQLGESFAIEDERPGHGYSSSGHAARASARYSGGTGPCSLASTSDSSASKSTSSCRATASVTYWLNLPRPARRWTADVRSSGIETLTLRAVPAGSTLTRPRPGVPSGSSEVPSRTWRANSTSRALSGRSCASAEVGSLDAEPGVRASSSRARTSNSRISPRSWLRSPVPAGSLLISTCYQW